MNNLNQTSPSFFHLKDLQEFKNIELVNPGKEIDEFDALAIYVKAIHWLTIFELVWPNFDKKDYYAVEVTSLIYNDPSMSQLPPEFFKQIAEMLAMFWKIKLERLYPAGKWTVQIHDDPEMTVDATILQR